jgi:hypothetical protein
MVGREGRVLPEPEGSIVRLAIFSTPFFSRYTEGRFFLAYAFKVERSVPATNRLRFPGDF